jgi:hypothetical protein
MREAAPSHRIEIRARAVEAPARFCHNPEEAEPDDDEPDVRKDSPK